MTETMTTDVSPSTTTAVMESAPGQALAAKVSTEDLAVESTHPQGRS